MGDNDTTFLRVSIKEIKDTLQTILTKIGELTAMQGTHTTSIGYLEKQVTSHEETIKTQNDKILGLEFKVNTEIEAKLNKQKVTMWMVGITPN